MNRILPEASLLLSWTGDPESEARSGIAEVKDPTEWYASLGTLSRSGLLLSAYLPQSWHADAYFPFLMVLGRWLKSPSDRLWISVREHGRQVSEQYVEDAHINPGRENQYEGEYLLLRVLRDADPRPAFSFALLQSKWDWARSHHQQIVHQALADGLPMRANASWIGERLPDVETEMMNALKQSMRQWLAKHKMFAVPEPGEAGW